LTGKRICAQSNDENVDKAFAVCKKDLDALIIQLCETNEELHKPNHTVHLLYCYNRGTTECCALGFGCKPAEGKAENILHKKFSDMFVNNTNDLFEAAKGAGMRNFQTIDVSKNENLSKCTTKDCTEIASNDLKNVCKQQKGFLKCCLRHTVLSVWEHQFCISVPFCTFKNEEEQISVIGETEIERFIEEQKAEKSGYI